MIPKMRKTGLSAVNLPDLSGGINAADEASTIKDNQLADAENMIFRDGVYTVRGGFEGLGLIDTLHSASAECCHRNTVSQIIPIDYNFEYEKGNFTKIIGIHYCLNSLWKDMDANYSGGEYFPGRLITYLLDEEGHSHFIYFSEDPCESKTFGRTSSRLTAYTGKNVNENGKGLFLYVFGKYSEKEDWKYKLYELVDASTETAKIQKWIEIDAEKIYVPTMLINGKGNSYASLPANEATQSAPQSTWESGNLLSRKFKAYFTTDAGYYTKKDGSKDWKGSRSFTIPWKVARVKSDNESYVLADDFKITYTDNAGNETEIIITKGHCVHYCYAGSSPGTGEEYKTQPFYGAGFLEPDVSDDTQTIEEVKVEIKLYKKKATVIFWYGGNDVQGSTKELRLPRGIANNLCFEGFTEDEGREAMLGEMSECVWFGGSGQGLSGGTRLFLYGGQKNPNKMIWSDVDNPLYFPMNNNAFIGDQREKITKLEKQNAMLVVFKERSLFYTSYVDNNTGYTTEDVINGSISDIAAISAIFPITHISDKVGCDLPRTVQLCDNHLVWANSSGRVYVLKTADEYSENNIYELSHPVTSAIKKKIESKNDIKGKYHYGDIINKNCFAIDFDGRYYLNIFGEIFIMNYADSGFKYAYSYREGNKVKRSIAWERLNTDSISCSAEYENAFFAENPTRTMTYLPAAFLGNDHLLIIREGVDLGYGYYHGSELCAQILKYNENNSSDKEIRNLSNVQNAGGNYLQIYAIHKERVISASFKTKSFTLGGISQKKRIEHIKFRAKSEEGAELELWAHTDKGERFIKRIDILPFEEAYHIRCNIHGIRHIALEFKIQGRVSFGEIAIKYKLL